MKNRSFARQIGKAGVQTMALSALTLAINMAHAQVYLGNQYGGIATSSSLFTAENGDPAVYTHVERNPGSDDWNSSQGGSTSPLCQDTCRLQ
jgi:hypothetical protein